MSKDVQLSYKQKISNVFSTARIYALVSIVCAHVYFASGVVGTILSRLGSIGVVVFLMMAGYFYRAQKFGSFVVLLKKKFLTVVIPWLILGTATWIYNFIVVGTKTQILLNYVNWMIGNGSYLYYLTVLFACFLIFYKSNLLILTIAIMLNIISIICTSVGLLDGILSSIGINNYLNIFNWIGFFAIGLLLQRVNEKSLIKLLIKVRWWNLGAFVVVLIILVVFSNLQAHYFSLIAIPYELLGAFAILGLSTFDLTKFSIFKILSNYSFAIYLIHIVIIGILDVVLDKSVITAVLSPLFIILVCFALLFVVMFVAKKLKIEKIAQMFLGVRNV